MKIEAKSLSFLIIMSNNEKEERKLSKKRLYLVLCITISVIIIFAGCVKKDIPKDMNVGTNNQPEVQDIPMEEEFSKERIQANLMKSDMISEKMWLKDDSMVVYIRESDDYLGKLFVRRVGEQKEIMIEGVSGNLYDIKQSFDGKYIIVNDGTAEYCMTVIVSLEDLAVVDVIDNLGGPIWSPDSNKLAFAWPNNKEPIVSLEIESTTDLVLYDVASRSKEFILMGDNDFIYYPVVWDDQGLRYIKVYLDDRQEEEFIYDKNARGAYEIEMETYEEKNEKVEISIKYPVLKNIHNKDIENKVNAVIMDRVNNYKTLYHADEDGYKETIYADYEVMKKGRDYLSLKNFISLYTEGAAHPNNVIDSLTFDMKTGKELVFKDLFNEDVDYEIDLNPILNEKVKELGYELFAQYQGIEEEQGFYLTERSLIVYYQTYIYTPHAVGPLMLEVTFDDIKEILK